MIEIRNAIDQDDLDCVRTLVRAYVAWAKRLYHDEQHLADGYFELIESELALLPGKYGPPCGRLLLAQWDGELAGTVGMHDIGDGVCEMKRLFVYPEFHGKGIGRALATSLIDESRELGYTRMRLDTSLRQVAAQGLYRSLGFREIPVYYDIPEDLRVNAIFMELAL